MSVILFFGFSFLVLIAGFMLVGFSIHNIWKNSKASSQESSNESANLEKS